MVQWLRLHTPDARSLGSIPGQGARFHMLQILRVHMPQLKTKDAHAATKTWHSQINKYYLKKKIGESCLHQIEAGGCLAKSLTLSLEGSWEYP